MSTTTSAASNGHTSPKPVESAHKPRQEGARAQADKPAEQADLFASLLSLLSDTLVPTASPLQADAPLDADGSTAADDKGKTDNPLAALLAWTLPGATGSAAANGKEAGKDAGTDARAIATGAAGSKTTTGIDKALNDSTGVDISGMTRVDEPAPAATAAALARAAGASRPAFSPLNPGNVAASARAGEASSAATASSSGSAAAAAAPSSLLWQRGAPTSTDALQQNHAASQAVRSTVALDERFGLANGGNVNDNGTSPALREFGGSGANALGGVSGGNTVAGATGAGDSGTGTSGDTRQDGQTDASATDSGHPTDASAEADAHTISHWGTQHMRHASLRVGGEGGADTAIDIQLSVKGQEVQVAFQTDNAEARASLRENAGASLSDLMQRSGIQLGSVSVGGQGQGDGAAQGRASGGGGSGRTEGVGRSGNTAEAAPSRPAMAAPRADGSRPLDVFA